ncbi:MAG: hypothetical protein ACRD3K_05110, partial [Edaphobacter sp.]
MKVKRSWLIATAVLSVLVGCKSNDATKQAQSDKTEPAASLVTAPLDPATLGTVSGTVLFSGHAPAPVKIDMSMDPVCSMTGGDNFAEQYIVHNGDLANVYVYIKGGPPSAMS